MAGVPPTAGPGLRPQIRTSLSERSASAAHSGRREPGGPRDRFDCLRTRRHPPAPRRAYETL